MFNQTVACGGRDWGGREGKTEVGRERPSAAHVPASSESLLDEFQPHIPSRSCPLPINCTYLGQACQPLLGEGSMEGSLEVTIVRQRGKMLLA